MAKKTDIAEWESKVQALEGEILFLQQLLSEHGILVPSLADRQIEKKLQSLLKISNSTGRLLKGSAVAVCEYAKENPDFLEQVEIFLAKQKLSPAHQKKWYQTIREIEADRQIIKRQNDIIQQQQQLEQHQLELKEELAEVKRISQEWVDFCRSDEDFQQEMNSRLPALLTHADPDFVRQGMDILNSLGDVALMFVLELQGCSLKLIPQYEKNAGVIAACILASIGQSYSEWNGLSQSGLFDGFFRRWTETVAWTDLTVEQQQRLLVETHQMVAVPSGVFWMRDNWRVRLTRPFLIGKYPVTQGLWQSVVKEKDLVRVGASRPMDRISIRNCFQFCNKLSKRQGFEPVYSITPSSVLCDFDADGYRLPSEAEWVYAAKAGDPFVFAGSDELGEVAWYGEDRWQGFVHGIGQKKANGFGLYDMSGNVEELCWDGYATGYYAKAPNVDPTGAATYKYRVACGGSFRSEQGKCIIGTPTKVLGSSKEVGRGFRLCRTIKS